MKTQDIKQLILANAEEITRLNDHIKQTVPHRYESPEKRKEWDEACRIFHENYVRLAWLEGYWYDGSDPYAKIMAGDTQAMEAALCFLEVRPYFFRSGYMFKRILRKLKKAPLSLEQSARLEIVLQKFEEWKRSKKQRIIS